MTDHTWISDTAQNSNVAAAWSPATAPAAGDKLIFNSTHVGQCTINQALTFGDIALGAGCGAVLQGAVNFGYAALVILGGVWTGNINYTQTVSSAFTLTGGVMTPNTVRLICNGNVTINNTVGSQFYDITNNAGYTSTTPSGVNVSHSFYNGVGSSFNPGTGTIFKYNPYVGADNVFSNLGTIGGAGTFKIRLEDRSIVAALGTITCTFILDNVASPGADRTWTLAAGTSSIPGMSLLSNNATYKVYLDLAGNALANSGVITETARGFLKSSVAGASITGTGSIVNTSGTLDLTNISTITATSVTGAGTFIGSGTTDYIVPTGTTALAASAFASKLSMRSVDLPTALTTIGANCFSGNTQLTSVTFLGLTAPTSIGANWIQNVPAGARGHAYIASDFPAQNSAWNGLTMGATIDLPSVVPTAVFTADLAALASPQQTTFTDYSTNSPTSWLWKFGDGRTSTEQHPVHQWNQPGVFTVQLWATNGIGTSSVAWLEVTVTNPTVSLTVEIGGSDLTDHVIAGSLVISEAVGMRKTGSLTIYAPTVVGWRPTVGMPVIVTDDNTGVRSFGGFIWAVKEYSVESTTSNWYDLELTSNDGIADRYIVNYTLGDSYNAGGVMTVLVNILNSHGEAIQPSKVEWGPVILPIAFINKTVAACFDEICQLTGYSWYIDDYRVLHFYASESDPCPISISDASNNYRNLSVTKTLADYFNCEWIQGADTLGAAVSESFVGNSTLRQFGLINSCGAAPTITLNGGAQTVGIYQLDTGKDWYWSSGSKTIIQGSGTVLDSGDTLLVSYQYFGPNIQYAELPEEIASRAAVPGELSTGRWERFKQNSQLSTVASVNAYIAADLARFGRVSEIIEFETDNPTIRSGQIMWVEVIQHQVVGNYLVTSVDIKDVGMAVLRRTVTAQGGSFISVWIDYFRELANQNKRVTPALAVSVVPEPPGPGGDGGVYDYIIDKVGSTYYVLDGATLASVTSSADATVVFQYVYALGAKTLFVRDGLYDGITEALHPPSGSTTILESLNCILQMATYRSVNTHLFFLENVNRVTLEGGFLEGDLAHQSYDQDAIRIYNSYNITLKNIKGARWYEDGIYIGQNGYTSHDITIMDVDFSYCHRNAYSFIDCYDVVLTRVKGSYSDNQNFDLEPNYAYEMMHHITFTDCEASYCVGSIAGGGHGFFITGVSGAGHGTIIFNNCSAHHNKNQSGRCGIWTQYLTDVQVLGGTFHHNYIGVGGTHVMRDSIYRNVVSYDNTGNGYEFDSSLVNTNLRWCTAYGNGASIAQGSATYTDCDF